jgi:hypothetical protein
MAEACEREAAQCADLQRRHILMAQAASLREFGRRSAARQALPEDPEAPAR